MADLSELEQRIKSALDRIGESAAALTAPAEVPAGEDPAALKSALAAETAAKHALEEKLAAIGAEHEAALSELKAENARLQESLVSARRRSFSLRGKADKMLETLRATREAAQGAVPDPAAVNQAMQVELDGMREIRDADRAELDALIAALEPLVSEEPSHA